MGRKQQRLEIVATLSDHNSEQDAEDEALLEKLRAAVQEVIDRPEFEPIQPEFA